MSRGVQGWDFLPFVLLTSQKPWASPFCCLLLVTFQDKVRRRCPSMDQATTEEGRLEEKPLHCRSSLWLFIPNRQRKSEPCSRWHQPGLSLRLAGAQEHEGGVVQEVEVPEVPEPSWGLLSVRAGSAQGTTHLSPGHPDRFSFCPTRGSAWAPCPAGACWPLRGPVGAQWPAHLERQ